MARIGSGTLNERITFQRPAEVPDGAGGVARQWEDYPVSPRVWAGVRSTSGREGIMEGRVNAVSVMIFTIRRRGDIEARDRIIWRGVTYNIRNILFDGSRDLNIRIEAERGVAQ